MNYLELCDNKEVLAYLKKGDEYLGALGYTDHSEAHCALVAERAAYVLKKLEYPEHDIELARIAGLLHDIGNAINRHHHAEFGAL
ncbi:MAG: HD domain-containing protein, partial [Lachnospiraceae bacterium]|nr:HD domain-containing protein [Lachnospiraceae bacterium]